MEDDEGWGDDDDWGGQAEGGEVDDTSYKLRRSSAAVIGKILCNVNIAKDVQHSVDMLGFVESRMKDNEKNTKLTAISVVTE